VCVRARAVEREREKQRVVAQLFFSAGLPFPFFFSGGGDFLKP